MKLDRLADHLGDRGRLPVPAPGVARLEPVETAIDVVREALFGGQDRKAIALRRPDPAGAGRVSFRRLSAAMQDDHQRSALGQRGRRVGKHAQPARIGAQPDGLRHPPRPVGDDGRRGEMVDPPLRQQSDGFGQA